MKWIKATLISAVLIVAIFLIAQGGRVEPVSFYSTYGWTASEMMQIVVDSSTTIGYQLKRRIISAPMTITGSDTVWNPILSVPTGQTITITEAQISCRVEPDIGGDGNKEIFLFTRYYDASAAGLDSFATTDNIHADSLAWANAVFDLTLIDSVMAAGDILWAAVYAESTLSVTAEGAEISLEYLLDE